MAKLGKGILGAPTGVIGNINCYDRLGKSIIQSRSYPVDSYGRRWNLLQWQVAQQLTYVWSKLPLSFQNSFNPPVGSPMSHFEYFLFLNSSRVKSLKGVSMSNTFSYLRSPFVVAATSIKASFGSRYISLTISPHDVFWSLSGSIRFRTMSVLPSGSVIYKDYDYPDQPPFSFEEILPESSAQPNSFLIVTYYRVSPAKSFNILNTSFFDPNLFPFKTF